MTDLTLLIRWASGEITAEPGTEITIGRGPENSVVLPTSAVSRQHASLTSGPDGWVLKDLGSTQGTFVGGSAIGELTLTGPVDVQLGQGTDAVVVRLSPLVGGVEATPAFDHEPTRAAGGRLVTNPETPAEPDAAVEPDAGLGEPPRPGAATTEVVPEDGQRPGGVLASGRAAPTVVPPAGEPLTVQVAGSTHVLRPGEVARIGREDDNTIVVTEATVSRQHARLEHDGDGWVLVDTGSSSGTWHHDARLTRLELSGDQTVMLGDRSTGLPMSLSTAPRSSAPGDAFAPPPPPADTDPDAKASWLVPLVAAVVVLAVVAGAVLFLNRDKSLDRQRLARATVDVIRPDGGGGSGTVIDAKRGLILTNAHVAAPAALGTGVRDIKFGDEVAKGGTPRQFTIGVSPGLDRAAQPRFRAIVVAVDGYLDLAVLKITQTLAGTLVEKNDLEDLTAVELGDSDKLSSGDKIITVGYPSVANSRAPTVREGVVSGVVPDQRLDTNRAYINTDAGISAGNSGGLAADSEGRLVAIPTLVRNDPRTKTPLLGSMRPVNLARELIDKAVAGEPYVSKFTADVARTAKVTLPLKAVAPATMGEVSGSCARGGFQAGGVSIGVDYEGLPGGAHTDLLALLIDGDTIVGYAITPFPTSLPASGCMTLTMDTAGERVPPGKYRLRIGAGGNYTLLFDEDVTFS